MSQNTLKVHDLNEDAEFDENGVEVFDEKALVEEEPSDNDLAEEELFKSKNQSPPLASHIFPSPVSNASNAIASWLPLTDVNQGWFSRRSTLRLFGPRSILSPVEISKSVSG